MKYSVYLKYFLLATVLTLASCKDDSVTPPPVNEQIFSLDSLSLWMDLGSYGVKSTLYEYEEIISASRVKLEYTLQSNVDSVYAIGAHEDSTNGTPALPPEQFFYSPIDSQFTYTIDVPIQPFYLSFYIRLVVSSPGQSTYYLRLRNIKVTKVS